MTQLFNYLLTQRRTAATPKSVCLLLCHDTARRRRKRSPKCVFSCALNFRLLRLVVYFAVLLRHHKWWRHNNYHTSVVSKDCSLYWYVPYFLGKLEKCFSNFRCCGFRPKRMMPEICEYAIAAYFRILLPHISHFYVPHISKKFRVFLTCLLCLVILAQTDTRRRHISR